MGTRHAPLLLMLLVLSLLARNLAWGHGATAAPPEPAAHACHFDHGQGAGEPAHRDGGACRIACDLGAMPALMPAAVPVPAGHGPVLVSPPHRLLLAGPPPPDRPPPRS